MRRLWGWWVARSAREMDARPLAIVRIGASACIVFDLLRVAWLGLVDDLFRPLAAGGIGAAPDPGWWSGALLGPMWAGPAAWAVTVLAFTCVGLGVGTRPAIVLGLLAYAQLGHAFPPGDRAIDRLLRTAMLVLLFSRAHRRFALTGGVRADRVPAWPADLLTWLLVLVYIQAGIAKLMQQPRWLAIEGTPVLYRVMADPLSAWLDPVSTRWLFPAFFVLGWATIVTELGAPILLTRWRAWWALGLAPIHLGIAVTMKLGMFSWGMLSFYPIFWADWIGAGLDRLAARTGWSALGGPSGGPSEGPPGGPTGAP